MSIFSANLRHYMEERGMSQHQLAEAADLEDATVSRYLNGTREPKISTVLELCDALSVTPNDLTGYGESYMIEGALAAIRAAKKAASAAEELLQHREKEAKHDNTQRAD